MTSKFNLIFSLVTTLTLMSLSAQAGELKGVQCDTVSGRNLIPISNSAASGVVVGKTSAGEIRVSFVITHRTVFASGFQDASKVGYATSGYESNKVGFSPDKRKMRIELSGSSGKVTVIADAIETNKYQGTLRSNNSNAIEVICTTDYR